LVDLGEAVSSLNTKSEDRPQERPLAIAGAPVDQESMRRENGIDKACCLSQSRAESVTGTTSDTWPNSPVLSADGHPAMPTTSASPNAGRSAKRSVTSSPSRCVAVTIARFTVAVTKQDGGVELQLIPLLQPADFGSKRTR
jgi:hypothetical protein